MIDLLCADEAALIDVLQSCGASVETAGDRRWNLTLPEADDVPVRVRSEDGWLLFDARTSAHADAWELLERNATFSGGVKLAISPAEPAKVRVRAEIPPGHDVDRVARVRQICAGLAGALRTLRGGSPGTDENDLFPTTAVDWPTLCSEAGWTFASRGADRGVIDLEVPEGFYQAILEQRSGRGVVVWVELGTGESLTDPCRQALGLFLLSACGVVRMARAVVEGKAVRWEVAWPETPTAAELGHALSALSVACRMSAREAEALTDETMARAYLAVRG